MPVAGRSEESAGAHRGWYVYGIVPRDVEPVPGIKGVGDPAGQVQVVRHGDIAALVSEINLTAPLGRPEDLRGAPAVAGRYGHRGAGAAVPVRRGDGQRPGGGRAGGGGVAGRADS